MSNQYSTKVNVYLGGHVFKLSRFWYGLYRPVQCYHVWLTFVEFNFGVDDLNSDLDSDQYVKNFHMFLD